MAEYTCLWWPPAAYNALMRFIEKIAREASKNETKQLKSNPEESNEH